MNRFLHRQFNPKWGSLELTKVMFYLLKYVSALLPSFVLVIISALLTMLQHHTIVASYHNHYHYVTNNILTPGGGDI